MNAEDRIVREKERRQITGRGRTAWWNDEREGRVQIGPNAVGWRMSELQDWVRLPRAPNPLED